MRITARIKPKSAIDLFLRNRHRKGGDVSGTRFRLLGGSYVASYVPDASVEALRANTSVVVEFTTEPVGFVKLAGLSADVEMTDSGEETPAEDETPRKRSRKPGSAI